MVSQTGRKVFQDLLQGTVFPLRIQLLQCEINLSRSEDKPIILLISMVYTQW